MRLLDIRNVVCEDLSWWTRLGPTAYWRWAGLQRSLYPTWVIQCHSKTFHHPVLHDSKPYLVFRLLDTIPSRDRHVVWSLSPSKLSSRQTRPPTRRPSRGLITISAQTYMRYTTLWSDKVEVKNSPQTWPLSTYNDLFVSISCYKRLPLFMTCLCFHHNSLTQPTYICLPCLSLFQNISHATSNILYNCSLLISLVFVPCPFSLPIYKIPIIYWHWKGTI